MCMCSNVQRTLLTKDGPAEPGVDDVPDDDDGIDGFEGFSFPEVFVLSEF